MEAVHKLRRISTQWAVGGFGAIFGVVVEGDLEAGHLIDQGVDRTLSRVDGTIENHGAHPVGETLQVRRSQFGSVTETQIVDLILAERLTDRVHIFCGGGCSDPGEKRFPHFVQALLGQLPVETFDFRYAGLAVVHHRLAPPCVELRVGSAAQLRRGVPDTARIKTNQVEVFGDGAVGEHVGQAHHKIDSRGSRTAGVHQQHTLPPSRGRNPDHRQLRLSAGGIRGVDRHRNIGAFGRRQECVGDEAVAAIPHRLRRRGLIGAGGRIRRSRDRAGSEHGNEKHRRAIPTRTSHGRHRDTSKDAEALPDGHTSVSEEQRFSRRHPAPAGSDPPGRQPSSRRHRHCPGKPPCAECR